MIRSQTIAHSIMADPSMICLHCRAEIKLTD